MGIGIFVLNITFFFASLTLNGKKEKRKKETPLKCLIFHKYFQSNNKLSVNKLFVDRSGWYLMENNT